jgi:hypothetical protein
MSTLTASTQFLNILVEVTPGDTPGAYNVVTAPAEPRVTQRDTVINYQIYETHGKHIVFTGVTVIPADNNQLSAASVSVSGKQLTFTDANSEPITLSLMLNFKDEDGVAFMHDPQIKNEPR